MMSFIYGTTTHKRYKPKTHFFNYPLYMVEVDVNSLDKLNTKGLFFGHNQRGVFSIWDCDYLEEGKGQLALKVSRLMEQSVASRDITHIKLVTIPRFFFKPFRPVSFYLGYSSSGVLLTMIAEVSNTYRETQYYLLDHPMQHSEGCRFSMDKHFHVSPFFDENGTYVFKVSDTKTLFSVQITYSVKGEPMFYADFKGEKRPLTTANGVFMLFRYPFTTLFILPRIFWQAAKLYFFKGIPAKSKPPQPEKNALRPMPMSSFHKRFIKQLEDVCRSFSKGKLTMTLPDKQTYYFGTGTIPPQAEIMVTNNWFFKSIRAGGEIGLGESYIRGEWESPEVEKVIEFMILNKEELEKRFGGSVLINALNTVKHFLRRNTLKQSKENIAEHYDLGNDFYSLFLDPSRMYSSAIFDNDGDSLEEAQKRKVDRLIDGLCLNKASHVLEIGSGWGYVAARIVERYGCKVTTITLSEEQKRYIESMILEKGLSQHITVLLQDYRTMQGQFDAIISIEMIEAVGHEYLPAYFQTCNRLLIPGGRLSLQAITYPDDQYDDYRKRTDFIRKHIFPGGHLPSLKVISDILSSSTQFHQIDDFNIAQSYAQTLAMWKRTFIEKKDEIFSMGFNEPFYRKWIYYFSYCEAAFRTNFLGCYQLLYERKE